MKQRFFIFLFFTLLYSLTDAQNSVLKQQFIYPLNIGLSTSGAFGEIRSNHFHSGIDLRVQQRIGLPVVAVADGYVVRIKVSPIGFGNALYINHANGVTSVYAHLDRFNTEIANYTKNKQYEKQRFDVDLFPTTKERIYVKQGQIIAYAGNSGSSGGAHLHFEYRNTATERIINPFLFGLNIEDKISPYIDFIKIYPEDENSIIDNSNKETRLSVRKINASTYKLAGKDTLSLFGNFSFGIQAFDYLDNPSDRNGWYGLKMFVDGRAFFSMQLDSFAFDESRYINASIDFNDNYQLGNRIIRSKLLPGNKLNMFGVDKRQGVLNFSDGNLHEILMEVKDFVGNTTVLKFWVRSRKYMGKIQVPEIPASDSTLYFAYAKRNTFSNDDVKLDFPKNCLYEDIYITYKKSPKLYGLFSDIHYIHEPTTPIHSRISISIKATQLPAELRDKALLVRIDKQGKRRATGGKYVDGYVVSEVNLFGGYAIAIDTTAPRIVDSSGKNKNSLRFKVNDDFSGIDKYRGELNGKWVLVEWDPKNNLMSYTLDDRAIQGDNTFTLYVEDAKGNKSSKTITFNKK